ncbi:type IV pilus twitching motility protein PilT [Dielma fastidiosa]|uniref:type IV pilus twitching motility protein PilT n=1 Tax=Dielma fastidiosa TaxID=1034346 RepID=UPI000ECAF1AF|nr:PilT/PilU family type 4a pilus ATPase [Dielma fastidiosa]HAH95035.1 type IV pili twitching motility protein PilT [Dielma fastidiosa]
MELIDILTAAVNQGASDIFCVAGSQIRLKISEQMVIYSDELLKASDCSELVKTVYQLADRNLNLLFEKQEDDFSFSLSNLARFRINAYLQRGSQALVIRVIRYNLPDYREIGIPERVMELTRLHKGLVLITGTAGSGKSTTLACMIDAINAQRSGHIITLEDPIEYLHHHKKSLVSQREIGVDTGNYASALAAAMRQAPDVILLGEMRDYETIKNAMTAAETGHLIFSTLHTFGAVNAIDRIIDVFPPQQQAQIRVQLSMSLKAIISQQLIPCLQGGVIPVFEILPINTAVANLIRDGRTNQIQTILTSSGTANGGTMDSNLYQYYKAGKISLEDCLRCCENIDQMKKRIGE